MTCQYPTLNRAICSTVSRDSTMRLFIKVYLWFVQLFEMMQRDGNGILPFNCKISLPKWFMARFWVYYRLSNKIIVILMIIINLPFLQTSQNFWAKHYIYVH